MKKGFTLIELIAVIALIALITVLVSFAVSKSNQNIRQKEYENKLTLIETASVLYAQDNIDTYPQTITVEDLLTNEYLEADSKENENSCTSESGCLINPISNYIMNDIQILISKVGTKISAEIQ